MALVTIAALGLLSACSSERGFGSNAEASEVLGSSDLSIESVSTRPYLVTGGDVLLRIRAGDDLDLSEVRVSANGEDVTGEFSPSAQGSPLIGLVQGLRMGHNEIEARVPGSEGTATLELTNYPNQFSTRARLAAANGHTDNHVMNVGGLWGFTEEEPDQGVLFRQMDRWLTAIQADDESGRLSEKVVRAKPADLVDNCWDTRGQGRVNVTEPLAHDGAGVCSDIYPVYATARHVAGAPLANNIVSCHLEPLDPADYEVGFSGEEWDALEAIFPDGVCDWTRGDLHGVGYQGTWLSFGPSEVNRAR